MNPTPLSQNLGRIQRTAFLVGAVGSVAMLAGALTAPDQFYSSYLIAFLFWLGPTLGSLAIVMLHNLTGGAWGFAIRRLLEAGMRNIPLMALLFVPVLAFGIGHLYEWSHPDAVAADLILQHKSLYLNRPFFIVRALLYFCVWAFLALQMVRLQARYDHSLDERALAQMKGVSAFGLVAYVLTMSFAAFDWGMSLEPHWFSTIYGVIFVVGQVLATFCLAVIVASRLARHEPFSRWFEASHFHDLGNLVMAFVMLWAYMSFSQFLIIWSGNLPEETPWYLHRIGHGWQALALALVVFHFAVPLLVLLNRPAKRKMGLLAMICAGIFLMRYAEIFWLIAPASNHGSLGSFHVSWMDIVAPIAMGGLWIGSFVRGLRGRPLVSLQDAKLLGKLEEAPIL